jgi:hypothetical protein
MGRFSVVHLKWCEAPNAVHSLAKQGGNVKKDNAIVA